VIDAACANDVFQSRPVLFALLFLLGFLLSLVISRVLFTFSHICGGKKPGVVTFLSLVLVSGHG